jgi:hypothetical protein
MPTLLRPRWPRQQVQQSRKEWLSEKIAYALWVYVLLVTIALLVVHA